MCPNQGVEGSLLPDCHIANRVFMYSLLHSLQAEERRSEEVDAQLRDRYEVFRQVLHNYPVPLHARPEGSYDYDYVYEALQQQLHRQQQRRRISGAQSSTSMENNASESSASLSSAVSSASCSSNLSARCDYYENAVRSALAQLTGGGGSASAQEKDPKDEDPLLDSNDDETDL